MNFRKVLSLFLLALAFALPDAGALNVPRHGHTTTLLPNGDIMVTGGYIGSGTVPTATVEIYRLSSAGYQTMTLQPMGTARYGHTATLTGDGNVLIAGGFDNTGTPLATLQLFDTKSETWGAEIPLANFYARAGHTATLLNSGPYSGGVLFCGGEHTAGVMTNRCSIYRPSDNLLVSYLNVPPMSSARSGHTATLITGGRVFVSGGLDAGTYVPTNEIYNPEALPYGQWQSVTALLQGRANHSTVALNNGNVLITGGVNGTNRIISPEEQYYIDNPAAAVEQHVGNQGYLDSAEIFDSNGGRVPVSGSNYQVMPYRISQHSSMLMPDGVHHIFGGYGNIVPTFFNATPVLEPGSRLSGTKTDVMTTSINGAGTVMKFLLDIDLSRTVDGRLVNGDAYFSQPKLSSPLSPSISVGNANIFLDRSSAPVDGSPVGDTADQKPGHFHDFLTLYGPSGTVTFDPHTVELTKTNAQAGSLYFNTPLQGGETSPIYQNPVEVSIESDNGPVSGTLTNSITGTLYQGADHGAGCVWDVINPAEVVSISGVYNVTDFNGMLHGDNTSVSGTVAGTAAGTVSGTFSHGAVACNTMSSPASENFDTAGFPHVPWAYSGNSNWYRISGAGNYNSASFGFISGVITHNQSTTVQVSRPYAQADNISFYYRVSSESGWDFLKFYIDGVQKGQWSGNVAWAQAVYPVAAGTHVFRWTYSKDGTVTSGSDRAWIDDVVFPDSIASGSDVFDTGDLLITGPVSSPLSTIPVSNFVTSDMFTCDGGNTVGNCVVGAWRWASNSGAGKDSVTGTVSGNVHGAPLFHSGIEVSMIASFKVPKIYVGGVVSGSATVTAGEIKDPNGMWSVQVNGGLVQVPATTVQNGGDEGIVTTAVPVKITGMTGTISNTTSTFITSPKMAAGASIADMTWYLSYTSTKIDLSSSAFNFDVSSMIVRQMIFADDMKYSPEGSKWTFGTPFYPVFNASVLLSRSADALITGGRSCDTAAVPAPYTDCLRNVKTFTATNKDIAYLRKNLPPWPEGAKLNTKRAFHTSTLLPDGSILTCGGSDGTQTLDSCELLSKNEKEWTYTGSMNSPRRLHTATLLPNGTVLVAGGGVSASTHVTTSAEIYYPQTGRWVTTGSMHYPRANHTATLLPNGNVLVTGGDTASSNGLGYSDKSEIYFTTMSAWADTLGATMPTARAQHTATLMKNGSVLVIGGVNGTGATASVDSFNTVTQQWSSSPADLLTKRYAHSANLLADGRVLVIGGSDNTGSLATAEIYNGAWAYTKWGSTQMDMATTRANHRATLLPNGKIMVTGGEQPGKSNSVTEDFSPDFPSWVDQSTITNRSNHTAVLTSSNTVLAIGGWNGSQFLDSVNELYFTYSPDESGFAPKDRRNPQISGGDTYFDYGGIATLTSDANNFHGLTEASGGGAGSMNSSHHNPRVYMQAMDAPSGFLTDLSTRIYTTYGSRNSDWSKTTSSITLIMPSLPQEMPYGWYNMYVEDNGQFSVPRPVQVTMDRPAGFVSRPSTVAVYNSSVTWRWDNLGSPALSGTVNGYNIYAASNSVFLGTAAFGGSTVYVQRNLASNSEVSIAVSGYNLGGSGPLMYSATYYTLPARPSCNAVTDAGFDHATFSWDTAGNSDITSYEVSVASGSDFTVPSQIEVKYPFSMNVVSSFTTVYNLKPNVRYYFRVRATNGRWPDTPQIISDYCAVHPSTVTVSSVENLSGTADSSTTINWGWIAAEGADFYNVYAVGASTAQLVWLSSVTAPSHSALQTKDAASMSLHPNEAYAVAVEAVKDNVGFGEAKGPLAYSGRVYTGIVPPIALSNALVATTMSITASWITNGNSSTTEYNIDISPDPGYDPAVTVSTMVYTSSVTFSGLTPNQGYYARLRVQNHDGFPTNPTTVPLGVRFTHATQPKDVLAAAITMSGVTLTWDANGNNPGTIYRVRGSTHPPIGGSNPRSPFEQGFSTYVAFGSAFTGTSKEINGLLTSTTYYFDVTARNGELVLSADSPTTPKETLTLAGPDHAPAGAVGGTSDPTKTVTITGTLPNGRIVTMTIPPDAFGSVTALAISSSNVNKCDHNVPQKLPTIAFEIFSQNKTQPVAPVTLAFNYTNAESTSGVTVNGPNLVLARYNEDNRDCLPLETTLDTGWNRVTATLNHFSYFQLMVVPPVTDLSSVKIYPNPFLPNRGDGFVTIKNLPADTQVRIYTISGAKVWEGSSGSAGVIIWKGVNDSGYRVASGVYLTVLDSPAGKKVMKIAVER